MSREYNKFIQQLRPRLKFVVFSLHYLFDRENFEGDMEEAEG